MTCHKITTLKHGDFFGETSLLNETPRSATIISSEQSILWGLFKPDLLNLFDSDPKLGLRLIFRLSQIVAERLRLINIFYMRNSIMNYKFLYRILIPLFLGSLFLFAAIKLFSLLSPFLIAYVLFFILKPLVNLLEQRGLNHILSVSLVFFTAFGFLAMFFIIFIPAVASEVSSIQSKLDVYMKVLLDKFNSFKISLSDFSDSLSLLFSRR